MLDATQKGHCVDAVAFSSWVRAERCACLTCDVLRSLPTPALKGRLSQRESEAGSVYQTGPGIVTLKLG